MNQSEVLLFSLLKTFQENQQTPAEYSVFIEVTLSGSMSYLQLDITLGNLNFILCKAKSMVLLSTDHTRYMM